ncbi:hypothetical protein [Moorena sp. SIO3A2]|uniref:hypothetical protein n=1 Tax=Moorena sp. SIO3A2 TaxID=2607841 RepID=UPI0013B8E444|nr:hypothetical protein [Moorena sp. SIO3A2]NER89933.1 hypothetical protein [Moorena sp. SIO3A2]
MTTENKPLIIETLSKLDQGLRQLQARPKTRYGKIINELLINIWEPLDEVGKALIGDLWRDVYLTIQDAIGLGFLYVVFGLIFKWITQENFTGFDQCVETWNVWEVNRYFCLVVVLLAFSSCITLFGRVLKRLLTDLIDLARKK